MNNPYVSYVGAMKSIVLYPHPELTPYIEKYVFYENMNITNDVYLKTISNGKVELFIYYNESYISIDNGTKEIKLNNFIVGISKLSNSLKIKPISENDHFKGISVTFSFKGLSQLLDLQLKTIINRVVRLERVLGKYGKLLVENILESSCNKERENILNHFFIMVLDKKKLSITTFR